MAVLQTTNLNDEKQTDSNTTLDPPISAIKENEFAGDGNENDLILETLMLQLYIFLCYIYNIEMCVYI